MKQKLLHTLFVLLIAALLTACGGQSPAVPTEPPSGGGGGDMPQNTPLPEGASVSKDILLDPALAVDDDSLRVVSQMYEGLTRAENNEVVPALAASWTVSEDGLDYIFNLRPGVKFQDGAALDADAVIANFQRWFDPANALHGSGAYEAWLTAFKGFKGQSSVDGIEKVDGLTVLVHLNQPDRDFLAKLTSPAFSIVSPAALAADGFGSAAGVAGGTGPYLLGEWTAASLTLQPNPAYWNASAIPADALTFALK